MGDQGSRTTLIRDLIDIPERVHRDDFVLRLAEGVTRPGETLRTYVVTPQLADAFDRALGLIRDALASDSSKAAYLHGSFGSASCPFPVSHSKKATYCHHADHDSTVGYHFRRGNPRDDSSRPRTSDLGPSDRTVRGFFTGGCVKFCRSAKPGARAELWSVGDRNAITRFHVEDGVPCARPLNRLLTGRRFVHDTGFSWEGTRPRSSAVPPDQLPSPRIRDSTRPRAGG